MAGVTAESQLNLTKGTPVIVVGSVSGPLEGVITAELDRGLIDVEYDDGGFGRVFPEDIRLRESILPLDP